MGHLPSFVSFRTALATIAELSNVSIRRVKGQSGLGKTLEFFQSSLECSIATLKIFHKCRYIQSRAATKHSISVRTCISYNKAGGSGRAARAMALPHFRLSDHVTLNG